MIEFRPLHPDDLPELHALVVRCQRADEIPMRTPIEELSEMFDEPYFNPASDSIAAFKESLLVGWGTVWHQPSGVRLERAYLNGSVDPGYRRQGIGRQIMEWLLERARQRLSATTGSIPRYIRCQTYDWRHDAISLYERHGMQPIRWMEELIRPLGDLPRLVEPARIEIVSWDRSRHLEVLEVKNSAFGDHWGSTPTAPEVWDSWMNEYGVRLDLSFLALDGDRIVGYSLNEHYPEDREVHGRLDGWIGNLGVLSDYRKRGIASALIAKSLHAFGLAGFSHAMIGVDTESPTGAAGLYRKLGFSPRFRMVVHQLEI